MNNILLIHSFIDGYLGYFHFGAVVINAAMNVGVQIALQDSAFTSVDITDFYLIKKWIHLVVKEKFDDRD